MDLKRYREEIIFIISDLEEVENEEFSERLKENYLEVQSEDKGKFFKFENDKKMWEKLLVRL